MENEMDKTIIWNFTCNMFTW